MYRKKVNARAQIRPEDAKYCGDICFHLDVRFKGHDGVFCNLFEKPLRRCLGGGPLRCAACIEAERKAKENP